MNILIYGKNKSSDTKKAERFFKERNIKYQYRDIEKKELSPKELEKMKNLIGEKNLIDENSKIYKKKLQYISFDIYEEIMENNSLLKTPVVREGNRATVGYEPKIWAEWLN